MNILLWHVHGSWTNAFVRGSHRYLLPVVADRGPEGRGRAQTWTWPTSAVEMTRTELADAQVDVVILQRPEDEHLVERWLGGRRVGRDVPGVWLEHNAPQGPINAMRHPAADRDDLTVVQVTHTNALFWDTGRTPTRIIEHGVVDPGDLYTGELDRAGVVINEPSRRHRVVGSDLLPQFARILPIDLYGMGVDDFVAGLPHQTRVQAFENLPQQELHANIARRRLYFHPFRWTSLGLSLIEAMHLGMPVVALATTETPDAVPDDAGVVSNRVDLLIEWMRRLLADPDEARQRGKSARAAALERYGLERFLADWDELIEEVTA